MNIECLSGISYADNPTQKEEYNYWQKQEILLILKILKMFKVLLVVLMLNVL